jgi:hypothetical protein
MVIVLVVGKVERTVWRNLLYENEDTLDTDFISGEHGVVFRRRASRRVDGPEEGSRFP